MVMFFMVSFFKLPSGNHHFLSRTCHGAGAAMCPAGATVLGDVLVASCAHIVGAIDVPPVP